MALVDPADPSGRPPAVLDLLLRAARPGRIRGVALDAWAAGKARPNAARAVFGAALREARALHSAERRLVQDALYGLIREERGLALLLGDDPLALWLGWLVRRGLPVDAAKAEHPAPFDALAGWDALPARVRHSLPDDLADRLEAQLGPALEAFLAASDARASVALRANRLRGDRDALAVRLRSEGIETAPSALAADALLVQGRANLEGTRAFRDGWFEVQDEGSQRIVDLVEPDGPVIDFCAGAGGKSLALAALRVPVTSLDVRPAALAELRKRAKRAGARVRTVELAAEGPVPVAPASRVLVDAPCTGSGVLRRHPELRWTYRLAELVPLQVAILDRAATVVRPGGRLIYATCSVLREEDEAQVDAFLARHPGWSCLRSLRTWPHVEGCDGFFAAVLAAP